jgi:hypothetical protein
MTIDTRIIRLEERFRPRGCDLCRQWIGAVLCDETGDCNRPECCPNCGRAVPYEQIVTLHDVTLAEI